MNLRDLRVLGEPGTIVEIRGQQFRIDRLERYTNRAGNEITLVVWSAGCRDCGAQFCETVAPGQLPALRRCAEHRALQPGSTNHYKRRKNHANENWRPELQCHVIAITCDREQHRGRLDIEPDECCDMNGCIKAFEKLDPDCQLIETFAGGRRGAIYVRHLGTWEAADG